MPKYTTVLGADYRSGQEYFRLVDRLMGSQYLAYESDETNGTQLNSYQVLNALASYRWNPPVERYGVRFALFPDNLLNKQTNVSGEVQGGAGAGNSLGYVLAAPLAPRTIGLRVKLLLK